MIAFMIGWGVFWLIVWSGLFALGLRPPRDAELVGISVVGVAISVAWIVAMVVVRVLA